MTERLDQDRLDRAEARLREAVAARVASVHPGDEEAGLPALQARVAAARARRTRRGRVLAVAAVAAAVALVLGASTFLADDGREQVRTTGSATTTSTTAAPTTTSVPPEASAPPTNAVWPPLDGERYGDPVGAARSFVQEYLGVGDAPLSGFRATTASTGTVDLFLVGEGGEVVRDRVVSTVGLAEAGGSWWVTGATSEDIVVDEPRPGATVGSPVVVVGRARGYEGNLNVYLVDGGGTPARPRAHANAIAGSGSRLERFRVELRPTSEPSQPVGSVLLVTETAYAVVPVRVVFTSGPVPTTAPPETGARRFVGLEYEGDETAAFQSLGAALVTEFEVAPVYAVRWVRVAGEDFVWLNRQIAYRQQPVWRVVDAVALDVATDEWLAMTDCYVDGRRDITVVAVPNGAPDPTTRRVPTRLAWRADLGTQRLVPVQAALVSCEIGDD